MSSFPRIVDLSFLTSADGFIIQGDAAGDQAGRSVSSAGDVNGDGIDDLIIGAYRGDNGGSNAGEAYVIFGKSTGLANIDLSTLTPADGFVIQGDTTNDYAGRSVSAAGDVNGDGIDDLIVGAPYGDNGGNYAGQAYVIFGRRPTAAVERIGTAIDQTIFGGKFDDSLNGMGGNDTLRGGGGNDALDGGADADAMYGEAGDDTYYVDDAGDTSVELDGEGTDTVISSISFALGSQNQFIENLTLVGSGNISGTGNDLANIITGNAGNNVLFGGANADRMFGGLGNDSYYVDNAGDTAIELTGQGTDSVFSSVNFELWAQSQHIETLTLIGAGNIDGGGNGLANTITGNAGNNVLNGGGGADRMVGGAGNDTYHVDNAGDTAVEWIGQGIDTVISSISFALKDQDQFLENLTLSGSGNNNGTGNGLANIINGNAGNNILNGAWGDDTLNGGAGNDIFNDDGGVDRMVGGLGNDNYYVGNAGDTTIEVAGEGTDRVFSSVSYLLWNKSQHIENLTLIGTANIDGGGNGLANTITGNAGNNVLNGGGNADRMVGGLGNDTYYVDNFGDMTIELDGQGTDVVMASVGFAFRDKSQFIENLTLDGTGHIYGTGNGLDNTITGNAGNNVLNGAWGDDTLNGGAGNDIFTGGTGADTFFFLGAGESDRITDFENGIDTMAIGLGVTSFAGITVTDSGADAILSFGTNTVTLENFDHALVSSDDFSFV